VPSELGYDYFCGNVIGEDDAWVSSYSQILISHLYVCWLTHDLSFLAAIQEGAIGRCSRAVWNFLIMFKEKEISLARGWCMKESNR
jgi:hypothetical protein